MTSTPFCARVQLGPYLLHLITFKWNVYTQGRTASQKYLTHIVQHNPLWINTKTVACQYVKTGDLVEITIYRPDRPTLKGAEDQAIRDDIWWERYSQPR